MIEYNRRNIRTWSLLGPSGAHGAAAIELAENNKDVLMLTADLCFFSGLERFKMLYPDRIYNLGIAEQNMIGVAAGLAKEGFIPFANTYASFCASRCADQVRVNMSYMKLPIKLIGLTAGYGAGILGATHVSIEDAALMRALPNITVITPADCTEIIKAMLAAAKTPDPTYIRLTGPMNTPIVYKSDYDFTIGKAITIQQGEDVCIIATGSMVSQAQKAAKLLESEGVSCSVINMHTLKPLDKEAVMEANEKHKLIVTAEEHSVIGGLYSAVAEELCKSGVHKPILPIGINDLFVHAGCYNYQMSESGLEPEMMKDKIMRKLASSRGFEGNNNITV
ncbi:transketolase family protein [Selenomonas ruminantium]|uniref:transketolase family protein n=1 Tax=Selenomonas ruminantium TaxID=971 RepID=UPI0026F12A6E|nr:transketolase C-terminal domain-containing protein [Selenomonas ruminantium]